MVEAQIVGSVKISISAFVPREVASGHELFTVIKHSLQVEKINVFNLYKLSVKTFKHSKH